MLTTSHSLLERLRQPDVDDKAWARFVALYTPLLYRWALSAGLQKEDANDAVQDVLLILLRELPTYQPIGTAQFRGWLWGVTRNRIRALRRRRLPAQQSLAPEEEFPAPSEEVHAEELALLVRRAAELLQNDFQAATWKAFWATAIEGRGAKEVADELGMAVGAIYAARFRVQQRIREELADFFN